MSQLPTMLRKGVAHHQAGRLKEAIALYDAILLEAPTHADTLHLRGFATFLSGDAATAVEYLEKAIRQNPQKGVYHAHLGLVHQQLADLERARIDWGRALALEPEQVDALAGLGALELMSNPVAARKLLARAVEIHPSFAAARANLAQEC